MKTELSRRVPCEERLPDREKDQHGELLRFTISYHLISGSNLRSVGYYDFELNQWFAEDYPEATIEYWLEPVDSVSVDEIEEIQTQIENCIQPHAITFNRGVIAMENVMDVIKDFIYGKGEEG